MASVKVKFRPSTVARQQKGIEALKTLQATPQQSTEPHLLRLNMEKLLVKVKRVCDHAILTNYEHQPTMLADRLEFDRYHKSSDRGPFRLQFSDYKKSLQTRLKSIEDKLGHSFYLLAINLSVKSQTRAIKVSSVVSIT